MLQLEGSCLLSQAVHETRATCLVRTLLLATAAWHLPVRGMEPCSDNRCSDRHMYMQLSGVVQLADMCRRTKVLHVIAIRRGVAMTLWVQSWPRTCASRRRWVSSSRRRTSWRWACRSASDSSCFFTSLASSAAFFFCTEMHLATLFVWLE